MDDPRIGRVMLVLRQRRGWRQQDLATRAGVSQSAISEMERGRLSRYTLATIRRVLEALDATAALDVRWGGRGELDRLLDADHARLVQAWAERHVPAGWELWTEASFSIYGERGRIDLLAFHSATGVLEVAEMKTGIWDVGETLGRLDVKTRLAARVGRERGWRAARVVPCLVVADTTTARRRVAAHRQLFARYASRGRAAHAFLRRPQTSATGLLVFLPLALSGRRAGQQRVRLRRAPDPERSGLVRRRERRASAAAQRSAQSDSDTGTGRGGGLPRFRGHGAHRRGTPPAGAMRMSSNDIHGIESGWSVKTNDDQKVGSVEETTDRYILVKSGLLNASHNYLPAAVLAHVRPEMKEIAVSLTKEQFDEGEWTEPPTEGPRTEGAPLNEEYVDEKDPTARTPGDPQRPIV